MTLARLFSYTKQLESQLSQCRGEHAAERSALYEEIRALRQQNLDLLDRVAIKLQMIPVSEPLKAEPLTADEAADRSTRIDTIRRSGPVAKTRQEAEAKYLAEQKRQEELGRKPKAARASAE